MKKYLNYKDSDIDWIGKLPSHWNIAKAKRMFFVQSGDMIPSNEITDKGYPVYGGNGIRGYTNKFNTKGPILLIGRVGANCGNVHLEEGNLWASEHVFKVFPKEEFNLRYFFYLIGSISLNRFAIQTAQPLLNSSLVEDQLIPLPTLDEQSYIAIYLDHKTTQINDLIAKKQRLIELLKEERAAIIKQAVTNGLNPYVKMKDSGIEWLGEIPEHWEVKRLKYVAIINPSKSLSKHIKSLDEEVTFLPMEKVSENGGFENNIKKRISEVYNSFTYFEEGDIIIAKITPCFENGKGALLEKLGSNVGFGSTEFHVLRSIEISKRFLYCFTRTDIFKKLGEASMTGAAGQKRVPNAFLETLSICYPKDIKEQEKIVDCILKETFRIDQTIFKIHREIELLQEYRTTLISEVVTGKIDVRDEVTV